MVNILRRSEDLRPSDCRFTGTADVDGRREVQMMHRQQLTSCSVIRDADDDLISQHGVLQAAIPAGAQKQTKIGEEGIERFTSSLHPSIEHASLVRYVDLSKVLTLKRLNDSVKVLMVLDVCKLEQFVRLAEDRRRMFRF